MAVRGPLLACVALAASPVFAPSAHQYLARAADHEVWQAVDTADSIGEARMRCGECYVY